MSAGTIALAVAILGLLSGLIVALLRMVRSGPEQRTADAAVWTSLSTTYDAQVTGLERRLSQVEGREQTTLDRLATAEQRAVDAEENARSAQREVAWLRGVIITAVGPLVAFVDSLDPPKPHISTDLRALLAEAEQHASDPDTP